MSGAADLHNVRGGQDEAMGQPSLVVLRKLKNVAEYLYQFLTVVMFKIPVGHLVCDIPAVSGSPSHVINYLQIL